MNERRIGEAEWVRRYEVARSQHSLCKQPLLEKRILGNGEWVARREGKVVPGMVAALHGGE